MQIKPLVWTKKDRRDHWVSYPALFAATGHTTGYVIKRYEGLDFYDLYGPGYMGPNNRFDSLEQAVQAAQTDYDNRILSALEHNSKMQCAECDCGDPPDACNWISPGPLKEAQMQLKEINQEAVAARSSRLELHNKVRRTLRAQVLEEVREAALLPQFAGRGLKELLEYLKEKK